MNLNFITGYIRHFITAGNEHDVHSPFVFNLLTEGIYNRKHEPAFEKIEAIRKSLSTDNRIINVLDLGAGSNYEGKTRTRKISSIAGHYAKSKVYCKMLYRLTEFLKPGTMVELGTSLGISAMYQSAGNKEKKLYTLEGCPETAAIARENFRSNGFVNIECIPGNFDETLPGLLEKLNAEYIFIDGNHTYEATMRYFQMVKNYATNQTVIIFDDINWSSGMKKAWEEIKEDKSVTITLDFFLLGIVFFNTDFTKQNFKMRM